MPQLVHGARVVSTLQVVVTEYDARAGFFTDPDTLEHRRVIADAPVRGSEVPIVGIVNCPRVFGSGPG